MDKAVTDTGVNAVIVASASGSAELVQLLLDVGGDAYQRMTNGSTALMAAVQVFMLSWPAVAGPRELPVGMH